ncbi:MAG TPA: restriction endonuclease [Xanthobacteraceae bacterium]|nr:restriction endonuclease [Xanthobacteraceae bacterium]
MPRALDTFQKTLLSLSPSSFENLTYDLLAAAGMQNLRWRTPGADGGRDIEGTFQVIDLSGEQHKQRWYVECKRYKASINWGTVSDKLAIAKNHDADFLLFVTSSNFSAPCRDEADRHNKKTGRPRIRIWPFFHIDYLVRIHSHIALKYGLLRGATTIDPALLELFRELEKLAFATNAAAIFGQKTTDRLELIASVTELISVRANDLLQYGKFVKHGFVAQRDLFDWAKPATLQLTEFDQVGLRSILLLLRLIMKTRTIDIEEGNRKLKINNAKQLDEIASNKLLKLLCSFGLTQIEVTNTVLLTAENQ